MSYCGTSNLYFSSHQFLRSDINNFSNLLLDIFKLFIAPPPTLTPPPLKIKRSILRTYDLIKKKHLLLLSCTLGTHLNEIHVHVHFDSTRRHCMKAPLSDTNWIVLYPYYWRTMIYKTDFLYRNISRKIPFIHFGECDFFSFEQLLRFSFRAISVEIPWQKKIK